MEVSSVGSVVVTSVATVASVVVIDGLRNISVVVSLATLLVDTFDIVVVEVGSVSLLVTMVTGSTEESFVGIDDNSDDKSPVKR